MVVDSFYSERALPGNAAVHADLPDFHRRRCLGQHAPGHVGLGYCQFRLVDRYWSRRNADFSNPFPFAPTLANGCQPGRRSDDDLCGHVCRNLSRSSRRAHVVRLVAVPDSELQLDLASVPFAAHVGRVRRFYVFHRFGSVLVHGIDPRPGSHA